MRIGLIRQLLLALSFMGCTGVTVQAAAKTTTTDTPHHTTLEGIMNAIYKIEGTGALTEFAQTKREALRAGAALARGLSFGGHVEVTSPAGEVIAEWVAPPWGQGRVRRVF